MEKTDRGATLDVARVGRVEETGDRLLPFRLVDEHGDEEPAVGEFHRRSNFSRRTMRPCADGNLHVKTWMIDDNVPEIAQALRLGHILEDEVRETYSHVAPAVEARLLQSLQDRWEKAVIDNAATTLDTTWRHAA